MVRSEGKVREEQGDVLGVYRLVDSHQARPLYKQDGGENFIFFSPGGPWWMVGTVVGSQYGWLRNSSSSLGPGEARWPADLEEGWQYRDGTSGHWREDDVSLRIQALPGRRLRTQSAGLLSLIFLYFEDVDSIKTHFAY